jgi:hypothetical protein
LREPSLRVRALELVTGEPADPPTLKTAVPNWRPGDTIPLSPARTLLMVDVRPDGGGGERVLVVEPDG